MVDGEPSWRGRLWRGVRSLAGTYVLLCAVMFFAQGYLLFHPTDLPSAAFKRISEREDVEVLTVEVDGASLKGFFVHGVGEGPRPTVLYFGGNAQSVWRQVEGMRWVAQRGFNLAFVSYRGYDRSSGSPSGEALTADALAIYDAVVERDDVSKDQVLTWGFSLGTGIATHVASHRPVVGVILMAPYDTLASAAAERYPFLPVRLLFRHQIDSAASASRIDAPALILHGNDDTIIEPHLGEALAEAWRGDARFVPLEGVGHNNVSSHPRVRPEQEAFLRARLED